MFVEGLQGIISRRFDAAVPSRRVFNLTSVHHPRIYIKNAWFMVTVLCCVFVFFFPSHDQPNPIAVTAPVGCVNDCFINHLPPAALYCDPERVAASTVATPIVILCKSCTISLTHSNGSLVIVHPPYTLWCTWDGFRGSESHREICFCTSVHCSIGSGVIDLYRIVNRFHRSV